MLYFLALPQVSSFVCSLLADIMKNVLSTLIEYKRNLPKGRKNDEKNRYCYNLYANVIRASICRNCQCLQRRLHTHTNYMSDDKPTADGTYIADEEWMSSATEYFGDNGMFNDEWCMPSGVWACLLIETADATDDAEDQWVICYDSTDEGATTEPNGGTAPQTNDYKLVITGHGAGATAEWYKGTGTDWALATTQPDSSVFEYGQSLTTTPQLEAEHYALEICIEKQDTTMGTTIMGYNWAQFVSYYDADTGETQQWPPEASSDVPDSWGYIVYEMAANPEPTIPEVTSLVAMLAVSSVAVAAAVLLRKRK